MLRYSLIAIVCSVLYISVPQVAAAGDSLPARELVPYGRSLQTPGGLELIGSAAHFGFSFKGNSCRLYLSLAAGQDHNYLQYEVDGVYQKRLRISGENREPVKITAPGKGRHRVWIYKATEAQTGPIFVQKIAAKHIRPLFPSAAPLIEFIGNSITCGAAADPSETPCGMGEYHDQHNAYYAYGPRVARALGINYLMSCVSGIGIYRNWNSDGPTMPQVYEKTDLQKESSRSWDFGQYRPRIVSIALGTNDLSNGDGKKRREPFDSAVFVSAYTAFVQLVKSKYPEAQIALLSSPMINGDRRILFQNCLSVVKANIDRNYPSAKPVAVYFFQPMKAGGCSGHPDLKDHAVIAGELIPFFTKLMN